MTAAANPDVRYIILHKPGPAWQLGIDFREQPGVREHVEHYGAMHTRDCLRWVGHTSRLTVEA